MSNDSGSSKLASLSSLVWQLVKPSKNATFTQQVSVYISILLVAGTLITLTTYLFIKIATDLLGRRLRTRSEHARQNLIKEFPHEADKDGKIPRVVIVGFFHPYCNAGGGGERVLWRAIHATLSERRNVVAVVYTGDTDATKEVILEKVKSRFELSLDDKRLHFVFLEKRRLVNASTWPRFTLLGQAVGSIPLGYEAISKLVPDVFIDTMGYAFTYPLVSLLLRIPVGAYVHYPMISSDMIESLSIPSQLPKIIYWRIFTLFYAIAGAFADIVVTNSTWTFDHIWSEWWLNRFLAKVHDKSKKLDFQILYPPCATAELTAFDVEKPRQPIILSIAQFRPEKRHSIIIEEFAKYKSLPSANQNVKLVLIGSVRDDLDKKRVYELRLQARELGIADDVEFVLEAKWEQVKAFLRAASVGVNAMWNEHFGMGVVEYMAAGLLTIVHESGGPKLDIVVPYKGQPSGFHFSTEPCSPADGLAKTFERALSLSSSQAIQYRKRAQLTSERFSEENFEKLWKERLLVLLMLEQYRRVSRVSRGVVS
ncbi:hypothetical protein V1514DRAFT_207699 [Lipomyces japonicus]|uniref:uncharacterized protein n=1 Tax=Lipomyces japonicus TaxID=56871 RepID=UPI0034CEAC11